LHIRLSSTYLWRPEESWVPPPPGESKIDDAEETEEGVTVEEIVEYPDEGYEEELVDQDEGDEEDEVEEEEFEEEEYVAEGAAAATEGAASVDLDQDQDVFHALNEAEPVEAADLDLNDDQDVFRLLDDAERAEGVDRSMPIQQEVAPPEQSASKPRTPPGPYTEPGRPQNLVLGGIVVVGMLAIAAIVLPFVLDYGDDTTTSGVPPTTAPTPTVGPPTSTAAPSVPTAPSDPTAPTEPPAPSVPTAPSDPTAPTTTPPSGPVPTEEPAPSPTTEPTGTSAPTGSPTSQRFGQLVSQFLVPISGEDVFLDSSSPQFRAAEYIADIDPYTSQITSVEELEDRYASITFYYATDGDNWNECYFNDTSCTSGQWLVDSVCSWFAVGCSDDGRITTFNFGTFYLSISFDGRGWVIAIEFFIS
jgi:hypothetical protein